MEKYASGSLTRSATLSSISLSLSLNNISPLAARNVPPLNYTELNTATLGTGTEVRRYKGGQGNTTPWPPSQLIMEKYSVDYATQGYAYIPAGPKGHERWILVPMRFLQPQLREDSALRRALETQTSEPLEHDNAQRYAREQVAGGSLQKS